MMESTEHKTVIIDVKLFTVYHHEPTNIGAAGEGDHTRMPHGKLKEVGSGNVFKGTRNVIRRQNERLPRTAEMRICSRHMLDAIDQEGVNARRCLVGG